MTDRRMPRLTWSLLGILVSSGLVIFGVVGAALPHPPASAVGPETSPRAHLDGEPKNTATTLMPPQQGIEAQRVADQFVTATDTTDRAHPDGDTAEQASLAPHLAAPHPLSWPEAWVAEDRRTTVALDPPGPAVVVGTGQIAVVVTGRMVVSTDAGTPTEVPVDERITLRRTRSAGTTSPNGISRWVVTDVGTGS